MDALDGGDLYAVSGKRQRRAGAHQPDRRQVHLAVPDYAYEAGLKDFKDIARLKDQLQGRIYGIEAGNDGNQIIQGLIDKDRYGLKDFRLVESSEAGMLVEVRRAVRSKNRSCSGLGAAPDEHPVVDALPQWRR